MKLLHKFIVLFVLGIYFGCVTTTPPVVTPEKNVTPTTECRTITIQEPYITEVCQNVSKMEEVCATRELNYSLSAVNKTTYCTESNLCVNWYPNGTCATFYCSKGATRCLAALTNLDEQKAGTWAVSANFTIDGVTTTKSPEKKTLLPKDSAAFDFNQFYGMDINQKKADCTVFVTEPARLQDCNFITKSALDCQNVTQYKDIQKQICE